MAGELVSTINVFDKLLETPPALSFASTATEYTPSAR